MLFSAALELATRLPFIDYLFPEQAALQDFEFTDFIYAKRSADSIRNNKITVVNFENIGRKGIAQVIDTLNVFHPAVIGMDAFFNCEKKHANDSVECITLRDPEGSRLLSEAIRNTKTCVLASRLILFDNKKGDSLELSDPMFANYAKHGFTNFPVTTNSVFVLREFWPKTNETETEELAFGAEVAWQFDSVATKKYLARNKTEEMINYSGYSFFPNEDRPEKNGAFITYSWGDILAKKFNPEHIRNRIVIIGGDEAYFSPLNPKPLGRAYPDMNGMVAHANVTAAILDYKPINKLSWFGEFLFALLMCIGHVWLLLWIKQKMSKWYDFIAIALIIGMLAFAALIRIELFTLMNVKSYLTLTLTSLALSGIAISFYENVESWRSK